MSVKPILFSTPMVQAIIREEDPKTQTRRVIKPQPPKLKGIEYTCKINGNVMDFWGIGTTPICCAPLKVKVGDILWVREAWNRVNGQWSYKADMDDDLERSISETFGGNCKVVFKPSIHMPKAAARIFLHVTDVRAERLQKISEADAISEGAFGLYPPSQRHKEKSCKWVSGHCSECARYDLYTDTSPCFAGDNGQYKHGCATTIGCTMGFSLRSDDVPEPAIIQYRYLWDSLNAQRGHSWEANPWVWVYTFEECAKPENWPVVA